MTIINEYIIDNENKYLHNPLHRNNTRNKSQWRINEIEERNCFKQCLKNNWISNNNAWSFYKIDNDFEYLGVGQDHISQIFIAKFVDGNDNKKWHGYPADHQKNSADIPCITITYKWIKSNIIKRAKIRKIIKGQPCNL